MNEDKTKKRKARYRAHRAERLAWAKTYYNRTKKKRIAYQRKYDASIIEEKRKKQREYARIKRGTKKPRIK